MAHFPLFCTGDDRSLLRSYSAIIVYDCSPRLINWLTGFTHCFSLNCLPPFFCACVASIIFLFLLLLCSIHHSFLLLLPVSHPPRAVPHPSLSFFVCLCHIHHSTCVALTPPFLLLLPVSHSPLHMCRIHHCTCVASTPPSLLLLPVSHSPRAGCAASITSFFGGHVPHPSSTFAASTTPRLCRRRRATSQRRVLRQRPGRVRRQRKFLRERRLRRRRWRRW